MTAGAHAVVERYLYERSSVTPARQTFKGPAAVLSGVALIVLGISIGVAGVAFLLEAEHALYDFLVAHPGFALLALGLASAAWGGARLLGAREWRGSLARVLANVPERMGGVILLLLGAALIGLGGFELVAPDAFDRALADLLGQARAAAQ